MEMGLQRRRAPVRPPRIQSSRQLCAALTCWAGARATAFQGAPSSSTSSRRTASLGAAVGLTTGPALSRARVPGPVVGFGTSGIKEASLLALALRLGYRLVDTAAFYGNEEEVGSALRETRMA
ncbi:Akr1c15, partial [Symbiodinium sp. CCMP2456]